MVGATTKTAIRGGADSARGRVMLTTHRSVHLQSNPSSGIRAGFDRSRSTPSAHRIRDIRAAAIDKIMIFDRRR